MLHEGDDRGFFFFKVKSGFLQEEDVKIVSKQIKDRIIQFKSKGNVVESGSKSGDISQDGQNVHDAGTSSSSGNLNDPLSQSSVNDSSSQQQYNPHTIQTQTSVSSILHQQSVDIPSNDNVHSVTSEPSATETSEGHVQHADTQQEIGKLSLLIYL